MSAALNVEIKARCADLSVIENLLNGQNARFVGTDMQRDVYFKVANGRLKLRIGTIENQLIHYQRTESDAVRVADVLLYAHAQEPDLEAILTRALGILTIVEKTRKIFFIENVKFHLDSIKNLGTFVEIEAIDRQNNLGEAYLRQQCNFYINLFDLKADDFLYCSYCDLLTIS